MADGLVAADKVAFALCLEDHVVPLPIEILHLRLERIRLCPRWSPTVCRVFSSPERMKVQRVLGKGIFVEFIVYVKVLDDSAFHRR